MEKTKEELPVQAQAMAPTQKSEGDDNLTPSATEQYPRSAAFAKNPASAGIATPIDNGMPLPNFALPQGSDLYSQSTPPKASSEAIPNAAYDAISRGEEIAFSAPSGKRVYVPPTTKAKRPHRLKAAAPAATTAASESDGGTPQTTAQKTEMEANLKTNASEQAAEQAEAPTRKGAILTPPPNAMTAEAALGQPIQWNRTRNIPHGNFTVKAQEPKKIINPAEVLRNARMNSPLQQQAIRAHAESENAHPGKSINKETGAWRKGVPLNAAVEEGQQMFDASLNYWRATVPPGQTLDEYNDKYQSFVSSLGEMAAQFAPQLEQIFFRDMPPAVRSQYNDLVTQQQEEDKLAIETARTRNKAIAERVAKEAITIGGFTEQMLQIMAFKEKAGIQTDEEIKRSQDRYDKGVALNQQKLEQGEEFAASNESAQLKRDERKAFWTEKAKNDADLIKAEELAKINKKPEDPTKTLKVYSDELSTALKNFLSASTEYNKATHDKDGEVVPAKKQDSARVTTAKENMDSAKKNLAFWQKKYGETISEIASTK